MSTPITDWSFGPKSFDRIPAIAFVTRRVYHGTESLFSYTQVREWLAHAKYRGDPAALHELAVHALDLALAATCDALEWDGAGEVYIVPIPSSPMRYLRHGFDHMRGVARRAKARLGCDAALVRYGFTSPLRRSSWLDAPQARKNAAQRKTSTPFVARHTNNTAPFVILVDDVVTTGSTLAAATAALAKIGIRSHAVAVAARLYT